jgi:hypothetical protein
MMLLFAEVKEAIQLGGVRKLVVGIVLSFFLCNEGFACSAPADQYLFFDEVPDLFFDDFHRGFQILVAADISILDVAPPITDVRNPLASFQIAHARVNRVLRGAVDSGSVRILLGNNSCDPQLRVGATGIVIGDLRRNAEGEYELFLLTESRYDRSTRKSVGK